MCRYVYVLDSLADSSKSMVFSAQVLIKSLNLSDYFVNRQGSLRCLHLPCGLMVEPSVQVLWAVLKGFSRHSSGRVAVHVRACSEAGKNTSLSSGGKDTAEDW